MMFLLCFDRKVGVIIGDDNTLEEKVRSSRGHSCVNGDIFQKQ